MDLEDLEVDLDQEGLITIGGSGGIWLLPAGDARGDLLGIRRIIPSIQSETLEKRDNSKNRYYLGG